jgi:hypothetical protein
VSYFKIATLWVELQHTCHCCNTNQRQTLKPILTNRFYKVIPNCLNVFVWVCLKCSVIKLTDSQEKSKIKLFFIFLLSCLTICFGLNCWEQFGHCPLPMVNVIKLFIRWLTILQNKVVSLAAARILCQL